MWFWFLVKSILYIPFRIIFPTRIINKKELKKYRGKGVVFCCNHRSYTDGGVLYFRLWRKKRFLAKPDLFNTKFKNAMWRGLSCYPVERGKDLSLIKYSIEMLKKKHAIVIFPEGMRAFSAEDALALRNGAAMIAIKGGVPIVPMVLKRTPRPFVPNALKIGTAISTKQYQDRKLEKADLAELSGKIQTAMAELLDGFGVERKPKWWEKQESEKVRGVVIQNDKVLLMKRTQNGKDWYMFPGGHIEKGETARDAVVREIKEESDVETSPIRLLYKCKFKDVLESFFSCSYKSGDSKTMEGDESILVPLTELKNLDLRPHAVRDQLCKDIKKYGVTIPRTPKYVK